MVYSPQNAAADWLLSTRGARRRHAYRCVSVRALFLRIDSARESRSDACRCGPVAAPRSRPGAYDVFGRRRDADLCEKAIVRGQLAYFARACFRVRQSFLFAWWKTAPKGVPQSLQSEGTQRSTDRVRGPRAPVSAVILSASRRGLSTTPGAGNVREGTARSLAE
jgi:hypothetical protein